MFKRILLVTLILLGASCTWAQTGALEGFCNQGGTQASTSGLKSSNYQQGNIPSCTVTVYLTGTTTLATIYSDKNNTPLANPFTADATASVFPGHWIFWADKTQAYDVVGSGGISPNTYPSPVPLCTDCYPSTQLVSQMNLQHNSSPTGILQSLYNLCDNGSCGPTLDAGMQQVIAKTGAGDGSWMLETAAAAGSIQPTYQVPVAGQHIIMLPYSCSGNGAGFATPSCGAAPGYSMSLSIYTKAPFGQASITDTGWAYNGVEGLPSFVSAANVTAVYGGVTSWWTGGSYQTTCGGPNFDAWSNGTNTYPPGLSGHFPYTATTTLTQIDGGSPTTFNYTTGYLSIGNQQSTLCSGTSTRVAIPYLVVYYTGAAPPASTNLNIAQPLTLTNNTLGFLWPNNEALDTGTSTAYAISIPWMTLANIGPGTDVWMDPANTNTVTNPTLNLNSFGAGNILGPGSGAIAVGDIVAGQMAHLVDGADGKWHLQDPQTGGGGGAVSSVFGRTGAVTAQSADYSVSQVTGAAPLASPTFTGTVSLPSTTVIGGAPTNGQFWGYNGTSQGWYTPSGGGGVTWPASGDIVTSNGTSSPGGIAPVDGDCVVGSGGAWIAGSCSGSGSGLSGMTAGQVPIAATATTVTSSKALAGAGAGITTGPTTTTLNDCVKFGDTAGTLADTGAPCGSGGGAINPGSGYALPAYPSASGATLSPSHVTTDSTGNNLAVPGTVTAGGASPLAVGGQISFSSTSNGMTPTANQLGCTDVANLMTCTNNGGSAFTSLMNFAPDGISITCSGGTCSATSSAPPTITVANDGTTGTTLNKLAKLAGAPSTAVIAATTDTGGMVGVVTAGAGTTGSAVIQIGGTVNCVFAGGTTAGDYVQASTGVGGDCADAGSSYPATGQIIGRVLSTNVGGGTYSMDLFPAEIKAVNGGAYPTAVSMTASNSPELDFTTCITGSYRDYELRFSDVTPANTGTNLTVQVSTNGGTTYDTTNGHYIFGYTYQGISQGTGGPAGAGDNSLTGFYAGGYATTTAATVDGTMRIFNLPNSTAFKRATFLGTADNGTTAFSTINTAGSLYNQTAAVNAIRVIATSGNIASGVVTCQPLP